RRQHFVDRVLQAREQLPLLDGGRGRRRIRRETGPLLRLEWDLPSLPRALAQLHGRLEQRELVRPRGEAALPAELVETAEDAEHRVVRRLEGDLVELVASQMGQQRASTADLEPSPAAEP